MSGIQKYNLNHKKKSHKYQYVSCQYFLYLPLASVHSPMQSDNHPS